METTTSPHKKTPLQVLSQHSATKGGRIFKEIDEDEIEEATRMAGGAEGVEGRDIDPDALAFIKAKRKVDDLQKAKKAEKRIGAH